MIAFHALYCHLLRLFSWHCWSIFRIRDFWAVDLFWRFNMLSNQYHSPTCTHTLNNTSNGTQTQLNTHIYTHTHQKIRRYYVVREDTAYLSIIYKHSISTPHPVNRCIHRFLFSVPRRFGASLHLHETHLRERQHEVLWHRALKKGSREGCQIGIFQLFQFCEAFLWISFSIHAGYPSVGPQWVKGSTGQKSPQIFWTWEKRVTQRGTVVIPVFNQIFEDAF